MGGGNSLPLDEAVLKPMGTLKGIADYDPYWEVLFNRTSCFNKKSLELMHVPVCISNIKKSRPNTLKQLVRLGIAKLIDLIHQISLKTAPDSLGSSQVPRNFNSISSSQIRNFTVK